MMKLMKQLVNRFLFIFLIYVEDFLLEFSSFFITIDFHKTESIRLINKQMFFFFSIRLNGFSFSDKMTSSIRRQINWKDLFPTQWSFPIFVTYMALFINQGLLITGSKSSSHTYSYNTIVVVLMTESVKLICATIIYLHK